MGWHPQHIPQIYLICKAPKPHPTDGWFCSPPLGEGINIPPRLLVKPTASPVWRRIKLAGWWMRLARVIGMLDISILDKRFWCYRAIILPYGILFSST